METKNTLKAKAYFLLSLLIFSVVGCNKENSNITSSDSATYSGRDLFKGIFFAQGQVAEDISSIKNSQQYFQINQMEKESKQEFDRGIDRILDAMESESPQYFEKFKSAIQSKDHLLIQIKLKEATHRLYKTSLDIYLSDQDAKKVGDVASKVNMKDYTNEDGSVDYDALKIDVSKQFAATPKTGGSGIAVLAVAVVLVVVLWVAVVSSQQANRYPIKDFNSGSAKDIIANEQIIDELSKMSNF